ncbi:MULTISPECIES: hypothetical protein [Vibrio]|uniref:hypothetical protein n=1 Tax=Vibrio TaxID=662 RepID=UPI0002C47B80|nr:MULTISPECIES: hypothetical protein [Vibrio]EKD1481052.1 hypothetical protein [Vibrio alginolyticus]EKO3803334.1 hypothetical protein [Vibrio harveyi]EKO3858645.1 hypothetical protein [Vibrio harveyi]EKY4197099.1 hypothetical protein [Vibrio harveyi]ELA7831322.1 hypothetical protein [Vibrio alginolyticus]
MNEYVTHGQLLEIIELFDHLSMLNAIIVIIVYDLFRSGVRMLSDYLNKENGQ